MQIPCQISKWKTQRLYVQHTYKYVQRLTVACQCQQLHYYQSKGQCTHIARTKFLHDLIHMQISSSTNKPEQRQQGKEFLRCLLMICNDSSIYASVMLVQKRLERDMVKKTVFKIVVFTTRSGGKLVSSSKLKYVQCLCLLFCCSIL